jgi:hypothetical protein
MSETCELCGGRLKAFKFQRNFILINIDEKKYLKIINSGVVVRNSVFNSKIMSFSENEKNYEVVV